MGANQSTHESIRFFKLIGKADKADPQGKKAICEIIKEGDKYVQGEWFGSISGYITGMEVREFVFEAEPKKKCIVQINDGSEKMQLEFSLSYAVYGLINAMLGADLTREVEVAAWIGKNGYVSSGIKYADEHDNIGWTIEMKDQPKAVEFPRPNGKMEKDHTNVQEFWLEKFAIVAKGDKADVVPHKEKVKVGATKEGYDDLPF